MILPHDLLPWLQRNGAFPTVSTANISEYWDYQKRWRSIPESVDVKTCHPLYLWADDAQFNEQYEKIICIVAGHILDERSFSIETCWPLFVLREVLGI